MTIKKKILIAITAAVITRFAALVYWEGHINAIVERFPDIDPTIVRKLHREMFVEALRGKYKDMDTDDPAIMDEIFLDKVHELNKK